MNTHKGLSMSTVSWLDLNKKGWVLMQQEKPKNLEESFSIKEKNQ